MKHVARALVIAFAVSIPAASAQVNTTPHRQCAKTFTLSMFERAVDATYRGTRVPPKGAYRRLWKYAKCQRKSSDYSRARAYWGRAAHAWQARLNAERQREFRASFSESRASWYDDAGATASGYHSYYGVATCGNQQNVCYHFGTKVQFCSLDFGRCITAVVDDSGPYANGAAWDLNQNTKDAIGFDGVGDVRWRVVR